MGNGIFGNDYFKITLEQCLFCLPLIYRWNKYNRVGKQVHGTRFIAFKVPLKEVMTWKFGDFFCCYFVYIFCIKMYDYINVCSLSVTGNELNARSARRKTVNNNRLFRERGTV